VRSQQRHEVRSFWDAIVVERDEGDLARRWWFWETDSGRLTFSTRVDSSEMFEERTYHDAGDVVPPRSVVESLTEEGFDQGIFDTSGKRLWSADEMAAMGET
jgi:hypothetical protein